MLVYQIYLNYIQNINSNFMERNEDWIIRRNNFIEEENAKQLENLRNNGIGNKKKWKRSRIL